MYVCTHGGVVQVSQQDHVLDVDHAVVDVDLALEVRLGDGHRLTKRRLDKSKIVRGREKLFLGVLGVGRVGRELRESGANLRGLS
jgi:phosphoglycerate dehydrogenase-like enzyme